MKTLQLLEATGLELKMNYLIGSLLIMSGLGMVIADPKKRVSPVCWIHAGLVIFFIRQEQLPAVVLNGNAVDPVYVAVGFLIYGTLLGAVRNAGSQGSEKKDKSA